jgi:hypothetical protein
MVKQNMPERQKILKGPRNRGGFHLSPKSAEELRGAQTGQTAQRARGNLQKGQGFHSYHSGRAGQGGHKRKASSDHPQQNKREDIAKCLYYGKLGHGPDTCWTKERVEKANAAKPQDKLKNLQP